MSRLAFNSIRNVLISVLLACLPCMDGCGGPHYIEKHEIKGLTVVFLDEESLQQQWKSFSGLDAIRFYPSMGQGLPSLKVIKGFYNFATNTLYCAKWDYETCGHELHHAVLGQFHPLE